MPPKIRQPFPPNTDSNTKGMIAALGDSLTAGDRDDMGIGYPGRLAINMIATTPRRNILNLGRSGWTSDDLINGIDGTISQMDQVRQYKPEIALVWIGSNDLWYLYEYGPEPMTTDAEQQDLQRFEKNIDTILSELRRMNIITIIALLDDQSKRPVVANPPNPNEPAFVSITPADLALMSEHITAYNEIITRKAQEYGALTVDFYNTTIFTDSATLADDGNHPNQIGYDQITAIWIAAIEQAEK
jgi:lysophospholipase L1-like esterase